MKIKLDKAQKEYDAVAEDLRICREELETLQKDFD